MRSRSGPDRRPRYRATCGGVQRHARADVAAQSRTGRGSSPPTSMKRAGKTAVRAARAIVTRALFERLAQHLERAPAELRHLVEEQHAVVREADLARPRLRSAARPAPRPRSCGAARGTAASTTEPAPGGSRPATEWIARRPRALRRTSAAAGFRRSRRASIVLPAPGGPTSSRLWPPAAAISSARRASGWPRTSARSGCGTGAAGAAIGRGQAIGDSADRSATRTASVSERDRPDVAGPRRSRLRPRWRRQQERAGTIAPRRRRRSGSTPRVG